MSTASGRVYAFSPDLAVGEYPLKGLKVFTHTGEQIANVVQIEFDKDAAEGFATITACPVTMRGAPIIDYEKSLPCFMTCRTWVMVRSPDREPKYDPAAVLWDLGDGNYGVNADPIPQATVPLEVVGAATN